MQALPIGPGLSAPLFPTISDPSQLTAIYQSLVGRWLAVMSPYAYDFFVSLAALDVAVFGWDLWRNYHGDIRQAIMATTNKILILGFFLSLLMNGETWMSYIINDFIKIGKEAGGVQGLGPSVILQQGFSIFGAMLGQATVTGLMLNFQTAIALILAAFVICFCFLVITFQFIVTQVQTFLAVGMGYLFLGFGGSRWTVPYVERYFAFSVASGVKLMVLYMLAGAAWPLTDSWIQQAQKATLSAASVESCWVIMCGAILYAGIVWFASSTVSSILGGSPNLSHSDFVSFMAPMISAGVSAGLVAAGVASGGTTAVAGAATSAAGAAGKATVSAGGANPSGATPPQPTAGSGGGSPSGGSRAATAAGSLANIGASTVGRMPHGGSHSPPPAFSGFNH